MPFQVGQEVRIRALLGDKPWELHDAGWDVRPVVGDVGLVIDSDSASGRTMYTVRCTDEVGRERWVTEFEEQELEPLPPAR
jgi:hypothetical protein